MGHGPEAVATSYMCIPFGALFKRRASKPTVETEPAADPPPAASAEDGLQRRHEGGGGSLDDNVTAEDLAPTSAAKEEGGDATQGDFLMAAKARRGLAARASMEQNSGDFASAPQTPNRAGNKLGDIDVPQARWEP